MDRSGATSRRHAPPPAQQTPKQYQASRSRWQRSRRQSRRCSRCRSCSQIPQSAYYQTSRSAKRSHAQPPTEATKQLAPRSSRKMKHAHSRRPRSPTSNRQTEVHEAKEAPSAADATTQSQLPGAYPPSRCPPACRAHSAQAPSASRAPSVPMHSAPHPSHRRRHAPPAERGSCSPARRRARSAHTQPAPRSSRYHSPKKACHRNVESGTKRPFGRSEETSRRHAPPPAQQTPK